MYACRGSRAVKTRECLTDAVHGYFTADDSRVMGGSAIEDVDMFSAVVSQEEARLRLLHPTPDDIPTCMSVFDNFLSCNSTPGPSRVSLPPKLK
jgi:hypothetical protein